MKKDLEILPLPCQGSSCQPQQAALHTPWKVSSQQEDLSLNSRSFKKNKCRLCVYNSSTVEQEVLGTHWPASQNPGFCSHWETVSHDSKSESNRGRYLMTNSDLTQENKEINKAASLYHLSKWQTLTTFWKDTQGPPPKGWHPTCLIEHTNPGLCICQQTHDKQAPPPSSTKAGTVFLHYCCSETSNGDCCSETSTEQASRVLALRAHLPCTRHYSKHSA